MPVSAAPADFALLDVLPAVLDVSRTALHLLHPVYGPDGTTIIAFTLGYLNPAGLRMAGPSGRAAQPSPNFRTPWAWAYSLTTGGV